MDVSYQRCDELAAMIQRAIQQHGLSGWRVYRAIAPLCRTATEDSICASVIASKIGPIEMMAASEAQR